MFQVINKMLGNYARDKREKLGWTKSHVAHAIGISPQLFGRFEAGQVGLDREVAFNLMLTLHLDQKRIDKLSDYAATWFGDSIFESTKVFRVKRSSREKRSCRK